MTCNDVGNRRRHAAVGDVKNIDAGLDLEHLAEQMVHRAYTGRGEGQDARLRPCQGDEFAQILRRDFWVDDEQEWRARQRRYRLKIRDRIERQVGIKARVDGLRSSIGHEQRVSVSRRLGDGIGAEDAGSAGAVFHDDRLAQRSLSICASLRANTSVAPPAACGTRNFTTRDGNCSALVDVWIMQQHVSIAATAEIRRTFMLFPPPRGRVHGASRGNVDEGRSVDNQWPSVLLPRLVRMLLAARACARILAASSQPRRIRWKRTFRTHRPPTSTLRP